ncbi:MAG: type I restriction-modification enzyme R subunit C-terminal domain-containing protein [Actinomycetota bacterium]
MTQKPEQAAREKIDDKLEAAGWIIQDRPATNLSAGLGVAVREFPTQTGPVDYGLYVGGAAAGAVEAKPEGFTLSGVESQSKRYGEGLPAGLPAYRRPLPFLYESTGVETHFTNLLDPEPRSRRVFAFHRPETLRDWLGEAGYSSSTRTLSMVAEPPAGYEAAATLRARMRAFPPLDASGLWPPQVTAIRNLESSLADGRSRALIQMATGSGKTFTACNFVYRLVKFARAQRVLFLVDRANLGRQARGEFEQFVTPDDGRKFTELYVLQHLQRNVLDPTAKVVISTIQRIYSMLRGDEELPEELEERSAFDAPLVSQPVPVEYNPALPIEAFDVIVTDECHRSIYNLWRQVLEYFDGFIIGLTATPSVQTLGFFNRNLVMEYDHERAVAEGVNVDFDVFEIKTQITDMGSTVDAGYWVDRRDRQTRAVRWEQLDDPLTYEAGQLDRAVVAKDQIRTVIRAFRDHLFTEIFPGRTEVPKTLIFAKDDSHAEDIVEVIREEFGKGNEFCQKITYKTTGAKPEDLLASFRNSYNPRIAVTVDMIATGTDVKPLEIVFFMRSVKSRVYFEQMKGRGVRVIDETDLRAVSPDAQAKDRFVIVDAVGIAQEDLSDTRPLERKPTVPFAKLLDQVAFGNREEDVISSLASRLARLDKRLTDVDRKAIEEISGGVPLTQVTSALVQALDPDEQLAAAQAATGEESPPQEAITRAATDLLDDAAATLASNPNLRAKIIEIKESYEQTIDTTSQDRVLRAGFSDEATEAARSLVTSFERFIEEHRDEIAALEILYSRPYQERLTLEQVKDLAETIQRPPRQWTPEVLWRAYERLERSKVHGSGERVLADLVSLVRFALHQEHELVPYPDKVQERFANWMAQQENSGRSFSDEQRRWLEMIRDHIATSLGMEMNDFAYAPFVQHGGVGKAVQVFGSALQEIVDELNEALPT